MTDTFTPERMKDFAKAFQAMDKQPTFVGDDGIERHVFMATEQNALAWRIMTDPWPTVLRRAPSWYTRKEREMLAALKATS
jgi:hypothetical protein